MASRDHASLVLTYLPQAPLLGRHSDLTRSDDSDVLSGLLRRDGAACSDRARTGAGRATASLSPMGHGARDRPICRQPALNRRVSSSRLIRSGTLAPLAHRNKDLNSGVPAAWRFVIRCLR